ncbi:sulfotransferase family 2 domain-containing protein [Marinobacterium sedimentorum]|uniref:sulfotransferase family 2 domain-containing protein n=1 Tax=Marinobacterium sedimentorum TaxID=2927804 RepID=UPI0020C613AB|nr:sulfotransferase family 2 domain-containing protein [Marinobacterium sedimentorum]MCP8688671.1 sulfotransferase family protein [Marinobacterium sedimentorum]
MKGNIFVSKKIGYRFIPKTACTSIKKELYRIEKGMPFDEGSIGTHVHEYMRRNMSGPLKKLEFRFIVVRDPVKRFLSAYSNRVIHHRELSRNYIERNHSDLVGIIKKYDPSISEFIEYFVDYMRVETIRHHFRPIVDFLDGDDLSYFSNVYKIENIKDLENDLSSYTGDMVRFGREQTEGPKLKLSSLKKSELDFILWFYQKDYELLKGQYNPQLILSEYERDCNIFKGSNMKDGETELTGESPFIIWTLRRSGGTNLGDALFAASKFSAIQHEPFNGDRILGHITKAWMENSDEARLRKEIKNVLKDKPLIKHCFEIMPDFLNRVLAEESQKVGYKHVFLYREYASDRLLSLNYAQLTGIWGKEHKKTVEISNDIFSTPVDVERLITHEEMCRRKIKLIYKNLKEIGETPICLTFESIYKGVYEHSQLLIKHAFKLLGLSQKTPSDLELDKMLRGGGQGTKEKYLVFPEASVLVEKANRLGRITLLNAGKVEISPSEYANNLSLFEVWMPYVGLKDGEFFISGAIFDNKMENKWTMYMKCNDGNEIYFKTHLISPRIRNKFIGEDMAGRARFISSTPFSESGYLYLKFDQSEHLLCSVKLNQ